MYTLFLKIATRYLLKNKLYSFINIFGLAIGVASFVLIMLYVNYERSYDTFDGSDQVYRLYLDNLEGETFEPADAQTFNLSGPAFKEKFLTAIAFIILIISWLNYVNLATTKTVERAREVGIRKVSGAQKPQLIIQSLIESSLLNVVSIVIGIALVMILLPAFNQYIGQGLSFSLGGLQMMWPGLAFIAVGCLLAGLYPALSLSRYSPVRTLKGQVKTSARGLNMQKGLIVFQFLATIVLLVGTILVTKQINFIQQQPLGFDVDQTMALNGKMLTETTDSLLLTKFQTLKTELKKLPFVRSVAVAQTYPGDGYEELSSSNGITYPDGNFNENDVWYTYAVQPDYFELMKMEILAGQPFLKNPRNHANEVVLNETFARKMGFINMEEAVDKTVKFWGGEWTISGVVKDYHHFGLKSSIQPMIMRYGREPRNLLVAFEPGMVSAAGMSNAIPEIESVWNKVIPQSTFEYTFLDKKFEAQYNEDKKFGEAFGFFTFLAILIASMGLFGLTSYTVVQRRKEIGIRKVNGATITQILTLLNKDFVKWVGLAFIIAVPIAWYAMNQWLNGFAYKTTMSWWIFVLAGMTALLIALLTVSWQSFRAAVANPVDALRDE